MTVEDRIREQMEVVANDGGHVGTVDHLEGDGLIKLTRTDSADGRHHFIPVDWVESVETAVRLSKPADEVRQQWKAA